MPFYTRESLEEIALSEMDRVGVDLEVQNLFKQKLWDLTYNNMLTEKGLFFILTFVENTDKNIVFYKTKINITNLDNIRQKLNEQGFIFYVDVMPIVEHTDYNLIILEPNDIFIDKVAFYGGIDAFIEGL
jgi:uncharacterized membrane protein YukC